MIRKISFTKEQCACLQRAFIDANNVFDEVMVENPYLYHESYRETFVAGYALQSLKYIIENGFSYSEV